MGRQGGPASNILLQTGGRVQGGPVLPAYLVGAGYPISGNAAVPAVLVQPWELSGQRLAGGPPEPVALAGAGERCEGGAAQAYYLTNTPAAADFALLPSSIIAYYPGNEASGTVAFDRSGNGRNATYKGSGEPLLNQTGPGDGMSAPLYDGTNDYTNISAIASGFNGAKGTIGALIQMNTAALTGAAGRWCYLQADANNRIILEKTGNANEWGFTTIFGGTSRGITTLQSDPGWHTFHFTWDATGANKQRCFVDGILSNEMGSLGTFVGTLGATTTLLGATSTGGANPFKGKLARVSFRNIPLNHFQITDLVWRTGGQRLIFDGDSRTVGGTNSAICYPRQMNMLNGAYRPTSVAVGGQTVATMNSDFATEVAPYATGAIVVVWGGLNDATAGASAATVYDRLKTYWAAARAAGAKVVACTEIDNQSAAGNAVSWHSTLYPALNVLIKSDATLYDALADLGADTRLQDATNTTYFQADKIHLVTAGYGVVAGIVQAAVRTL